MDTATSICKNTEGGQDMREMGFLKGLTYMLAGCVTVLFVIFGLFPGSYLGGAIGINVAGILLGLPVTSGMFSRWIVAASMAMGVMVSGIIFITAAATAGWLISTALYTLTGRRMIWQQQNTNRTK
jgi:formate hydrogenlyase subunit 3/multisubunit Na+/H+ antiporter MnhD subunit